MPDTFIVVPQKIVTFGGPSNPLRGSTMGEPSVTDVIGNAQQLTVRGGVGIYPVPTGMTNVRGVLRAVVVTGPPDGITSLSVAALVTNDDTTGATMATRIEIGLDPWNRPTARFTNVLGATLYTSLPVGFTNPAGTQLDISLAYDTKAPIFAASGRYAHLTCNGIAMPWDPALDPKAAWVVQPTPYVAVGINGTTDMRVTSVQFTQYAPPIPGVNTEDSAYSDLSSDAALAVDATVVYGPVKQLSGTASVGTTLTLVHP
jgi:hypothetical protein